jgi:hypothetical protein
MLLFFKRSRNVWQSPPGWNRLKLPVSQSGVSLRSASVTFWSGSSSRKSSATFGMVTLFLYGFVQQHMQP